MGNVWHDPYSQYMVYGYFSLEGRLVLSYLMLLGWVREWCNTLGCQKNNNKHLQIRLQYQTHLLDRGSTTVATVYDYHECNYSNFLINGG